MDIGNRIKKIRKELDLTQSEFAAKIGSVQNTVTGYENGRRNPSAPVISLICEKFDVREEWLRTGEGEMFKPKPSDILEQLVAEYGLSDIAGAMVKSFINLKPDIQVEMFNFFSNVVSLVNGNPKAETEKEHQLDETTQRALELFRKNFPNGYAQDESTTEDAANRTMQEMSREELHAELDRQLDAEKEAAENARGYGHGNSDTAIG